MILTPPKHPGPPPSGSPPFRNCPCQWWELRVQLQTVKKRRVAVRQCLDCGRNLGSVRRGKLGTADLPPFDHGLRERVLEARRGETRRLQDERRRAWWDWYAAYLACPEWHVRRAAVLERDGGRCRVEGCDRPATQVHHLTYERVGYELLDDLAAVCDECHRKIHPHLG